MTTTNPDNLSGHVSGRPDGQTLPLGGLSAVLSADGLTHVTARVRAALMTAAQARQAEGPDFGAWQRRLTAVHRLFKARRYRDNTMESREVEAIGARCATGRANVGLNRCAMTATAGAWSLDAEVRA